MVSQEEDPAGAGGVGGDIAVHLGERAPPTSSPPTIDDQALVLVEPPATLAEHAAVIRQLGRRVIGDIIEIGGRLTHCRDNLIPHGQWASWLASEFGWSDDTALRFMKVHEFAKTRNLRDLDIPVSGIYLLARPATPPTAIDEVVEHARASGTISHKQVAEAVARHRGKPLPPRPATVSRPAKPAKSSFYPADRLNALMWAEASPETRLKFLSEAGVRSIWDAMTDELKLAVIRHHNDTATPASAAEVLDRIPPAFDRRASRPRVSGASDGEPLSHTTPEAKAALRPAPDDKGAPA
jgi:hypothetical protein